MLPGAFAAGGFPALCLQFRGSQSPRVHELALQMVHEQRQVFSAGQRDSYFQTVATHEGRSVVIQYVQIRPNIDNWENGKHSDVDVARIPAVDQKLVLIVSR